MASCQVAGFQSEYGCFLGQAWLLLQACHMRADLQVGQLALLLLGSLALPLEVLLPDALSLLLPERRKSKAVRPALTQAPMEPQLHPSEPAC